MVSTSAMKSVMGWTGKFAKRLSPGLEHAPSSTIATALGEQLARYASAKRKVGEEVVEVYGKDAVEIMFSGLHKAVAEKKQVSMADVRKVTKFMWLLAVPSQTKALDVEAQVVAKNRVADIVLKSEEGEASEAAKLSKQVGELFVGSAGS